jgi:hypothetical protein
MKPVSVAALNSREEAEPLRAHLLAAGIPAEIRDELGLEVGLGFGRPSAGVRVEVSRNDFEAALKLVYEWNAGERAPLEPPEWLVPESRVKRARAFLHRGDEPGRAG